MIVRIDPSATAPFEQLRVQIAASFHAGTLEAGRRLPPIRQLAAARPRSRHRRPRLPRARGRRPGRVPRPARDPGRRHPARPGGPANATHAWPQAADEFARRAAELGADLEQATAALHAALAARASGAA